MLKILIPVDFSANSKKGLRFAIQWSAQQKLQMVILYVMNVIKLPQWSNEEYINHMNAEEASYGKELEQFVKGVYRVSGVKPGKYSCVIKRGISADLSVMNYCSTHGDIDYICMATRGAGKLNKLFGTNAGNLVTKSRVPVIAVPHGYRKKRITDVLYATDFADYEKEIKKVEALARSFNAKLNVVHIAWPDEGVAEEAIYRTYNSVKVRPAIKLKVIPANILYSFLKNLESEIKQEKPSALIMFTHQNKRFIQRFLNPSNAEKLAFETSIPLIVFPKE